MKWLLRPSVSSFGATTIIFMVWFAPLASNVHETFFTFPGSIVGVVLPLFIGFFITWLTWTLLLTFAERSRVFGGVIWSILAVILLRELLEAYYALRPNSDPFRAQELPSTHANLLFVIFVVVLFGVFFYFRRQQPHLADKTRMFATVVLAFVAISGLSTILRISVFTWQSRHLNTPGPFRQDVVSVPQPPQHRVIWLLFDELSYNQLYVHRFQGLKLPAFDRLAAESTVFTHVRPEGKLTLRVVPALLSGNADTDIRMSVSGTPLWVKTVAGNWNQFDPENTVFHDAVTDGYKTAVVGWVFPYCRLFPHELNRCYWANSTRLVANMYTTHTIGENLKDMFLQSAKDRAGQFRLIHRSSAKILEQPPDVYRELSNASDADLKDPSVNFLYLHFNIPHPLGMYDRDTGKFSVGNGNSYIDNLALCDIYLSHLRKLLEANGSWDNTTLVIMGDHSWRTYGWSKDENWTPEENIASNGGQFDDRPGYIVKLAGQTTSAQYDAPFEAVRSRALFQQLLTNNITTPEQLAAWATKSR